jgi:Sulfotransferase domain
MLETPVKDPKVVLEIPKAPSGQLETTLSLLQEFQEGRVEFLSGEPESIHVGYGMINSVGRYYLFLHPPAAVQFTLPPEKFRLTFGIGIHQEVWDKPQAGAVEFIIYSNDDVFFRMVIDPTHFEEHRKWQDVSIELPACPFPERKLILSTRGVDGEAYRWALWSDLVVHYPSYSNAPVYTSKYETGSYISYPLLFPKETRFFFILGSMKSGTTWLTNVLNNHPDICAQGEMYSLEMIDTLSPTPTLEYASKSSAMLREWYLMPNSTWNVPFRDGVNKKQALNTLDKDFVRFFYEWAMIRYLQARNERVPALIGDKSPTRTPHIIKKILYYFGGYNPYAIHIVRDPRDVAVSRWFHQRRMQHEGRFEFADLFRSPEDQELCERLLSSPDDYMKDNQTLFYYPNFLEGVFKEWIAVNDELLSEGVKAFGDRYILIRYEDLKADFGGTLRGILERFEVDASEEIIDKIQTNTDVNRMKIKPSVFRKGAVGDWRIYFREEEMELFEKMVSPISKQLGYE